MDKITRLDDPSLFGQSDSERQFNVALELIITWINRILFLKLLEAQLLAYNKYNQLYSFLNINTVKNFDDLNSLFFQVLAKRTNERNDDIEQIYFKVPYLNSSLFEPKELEHSCLFISQLKDRDIPLFQSTIIKDRNGKKKKGNLNTLEYLFEFLNAYDFASDGSEEIQEENKTLINASVLGLIFEKINGYKDGSFFTPGYVTMYMCREIIQSTILKKFNEVKEWKCSNLTELYNSIVDKIEANRIINDLKICDPAVGSGHFLVSALNEIIAVKSFLRILQDDSGRTLRDYNIEVVNDDLIITDEEGKIFAYNPANVESQRVQRTLFQEKQTIIENCLFGVDINPNSVKICRLRLWIELLKNSYYKSNGKINELETLPNIDINIKCGNSLISRHKINTEIGEALKKSKWTIGGYREAIMAYRNADEKAEKRKMESLIQEIKSDLEITIGKNDKRVLRLKKLYLLS